MGIRSKGGALSGREWGEKLYDSSRERFNASEGRDGISCGARRVWELLHSHRIYGSGVGKVSRLNIPGMKRKDTGNPWDVSAWCDCPHIRDRPDLPPGCPWMPIHPSLDVLLG